MSQVTSVSLFSLIDAFYQDFRKQKRKQLLKKNKNREIAFFFKITSGRMYPLLGKKGDLWQEEGDSIDNVDE